MLLLPTLILAQNPRTAEYPGQMYAVAKGLRTVMPLERTSVSAEIAGMGARVTVKQTFANPNRTSIEALYTFPLPDDAAVDRMRIKIGTRVIDGAIMRREAAKAAYEAAKAQGKTAALLDQETDNVFTQSVANIRPGSKVEVEISYVQVLKFEDGEFEFSYPMVVAPRFMGKGSPAGVATATLPPGVRSGANVDLAVTLHGGAPIQEFRSVLHQVRATKPDAETVRIELAKADEIANRDFVLRYRTASREVSEATFATWDEKRGGHFALVLAPPPTPLATLRNPKETIFVIDQSGSQSGFPIDKSKELALALMDTMGPKDAFNAMGFSNEVNPLWPEPRPNTPENRAEARAFVKSLEANGGTELEKAVVASLSAPTDPGRVRIVLFNTDGLAGQESVILSNVQRYRGTSRLFTYGIGNSVNRALIDAMSVEGRGAAEVVTLAEGAEGAKKRLAKRLESPLLVDPKAEFAEGTVTGVTPAHLPDVFSAKPVVVFGRYTKPGKARLTLSGMRGGAAWSREIAVDLPATAGDGSAVASLWARARLAEMKAHGYAERAMGRKAENEEAMTKLALDYGILSETTSFVAIDHGAGVEGKATTVRVPTEMPDGMSLGMPGAAAPMLKTGGALSRSRATGGRGGALGGFAGGRGGANSYNMAADGAVDRLQDGAYDPIAGKFVAPKAGLHTVLIAKSLLEAKGAVDVRVEVSKTDAATLAALRKAGLRVGSHDGATLVFGSATGAQLREVAKLAFVSRIEGLRRA